MIHLSVGSACFYHTFTADGPSDHKIVEVGQGNLNWDKLSQILCPGELTQLLSLRSFIKCMISYKFTAAYSDFKIVLEPQKKLCQSLI